MRVFLVLLMACTKVPLPEAPPARAVAITIDDLPIAHGAQNGTPARRAEIADRLCELASHHPVTGFFNPVHHETYPEVVERLLACGIEVGNHTWSHPHLDRVGLDAFLADLRQGHDALAPHATAPMPFRFPYLFEGLDPVQRDRVRAELVALGEVHAPVTIDTWDWLYAKGFLDAEDPEIASWYARGWRWNFEEATLAAEHQSQDLFGHEPPQILLVHGNLLTARMLPDAIAWLQDRGYRTISLRDALSDPAYAEPDPATSPTGDGHWLRLRRSRSLLQEELMEQGGPASDAHATKP